jgi:type IV pilus assembly protein PilO
MKKQETLNKFLDERYIPLEPKFKIIGAVLLLAVPVALFYFLQFSPNKDTIERLHKQEAKLAKEVQTAQKQAGDIKKFQKEFDETELKFLETADMLPEGKEIPQLLKDISSLGQNAGLDFAKFSPGAESPKDFYAEFPINLSVKGPYHNMGFFLDQVSKLNRIVTVSNIKMGGAKEDGNELILNSTCSLLTYRFTNKALTPPKDDKKGKKRR